MDEKPIPEDVQVVQDLYAAFGRWDLPAVGALLDEAIAWHCIGRPDEIPFAGRHQGRQEIIDFLGRKQATCAIFSCGPDEIYVSGGHIVALGCERGRVRATGRAFKSDWLQLFSIRGGRIVQVREFYDTAALVQAFHPPLSL